MLELQKIYHTKIVFVLSPRIVLPITRIFLAGGITAIRIELHFNNIASFSDNDNLFSLKIGEKAGKLNVAN